MIVLAEMAGLEPANTGVKVLCLTNLATPQYLSGRLKNYKFVARNFFYQSFLAFLDILPQLT
jgi:hypothetical protein